MQKSEDIRDVRELDELKQKYTLGKINFDSVIIIDFDNGLKSILASLAYTDVSEQEILIITANQWFDRKRKRKIPRNTKTNSIIGRVIR